MSSSLGIALLALGFGVLVATFRWIARLLARGEGGAAAGEEPVRRRGRGYGTQYGLLLGVLATALFLLTQTPLLLALPCVGSFYSGRALWRGLRHFRVVLWRALLALALNMAAAAMHYLHAIGQWPPAALDAGAAVL